MKVTKDCTILIMGLLYLSILIYSITDIINYKEKILKNKKIFEEQEINNLINQNYFEFALREIKLQNNAIESILQSILTFSLLFIINLLVYFTKTNDLFFDVFSVFIRILVYSNFFGTNSDKCIIIFLSMIGLFLVPFIIPLHFSTLFYLITLPVYFLIIILNRKNIIPDKPSKYDRKKILRIALFWIIPLYFIFSLYSLALTSSLSNSLPEQFNGKCKELALKHFGPKNVYYLKGSSVNIGTSSIFHKTILVVMGDWSSFSQEEILGCIAHEIGHGGPLEGFFLFLFGYFLKVLSLFIYCELMNHLSKRIKSRFHKNTLWYFLFYINIYFLMIIWSFMNNAFGHSIEYLADRRALTISKEANLVGVLFKMCAKKEYPFYTPKLLSYYKGDHPSSYHRISEILKIKK